MQTREIPFSELISSSLNPRSSVANTFRDQLKTSILNSGLMTPLTVRKNGLGYIVLDGNTRLDVLQELEQDCQVNCVSCVVLDEDEEVDDVQYALLVNQLRRPIDPWDESAAYHSMVITDGKSFSETAKAFGVTEKHVRQRIALAELPSVGREYWKAGNIDADALHYMTTLDKDVIEHYIEDLQHVDESITGWDIRRYAHKYTYNPEVAIFEEAALQGVISTDLFGDEQYVSDNKAFRSRQLEAINNLAQHWKGKYPNAEVEHIEVDDIWNVADTFRKNYDTVQSIALNSSYRDELEELISEQVDVIQIYYDNRMHVRFMAGRMHLGTDVKPQTDTPVREYAGVLLATAKYYWRLSFCEFLMISDADVCIDVLKKLNWHTANPSVLRSDPKMSVDKILEKRINTLNKALEKARKSPDKSKTLAAFAARCAAGHDWMNLHPHLITDKDFHKYRKQTHKVADSYPASAFLFSKMRKPMLIQILSELEPDADASNMNKEELVDACTNAAAANNWMPPIDLLQ